jgi:hypothetical protein
MKRLSTCILVAACAAAVASGCGSSTSPSQLNLTGGWHGTLTITVQGGSGAMSVFYSLNQSGSTVTGTSIIGDDPSASISMATLSGNTLTITSHPGATASDDCSAYSQTFTYTVSDPTMTVTAASGTLCSGDGHGGHTSLTPITGATGTLRRTTS